MSGFLKSMKLTFPLFLVVAAFVWGNSCNGPMPKTTVYASPGDLTNVEGLQECPFFNAFVDDQKAFVYYSKNALADSAYNGRGVSYLNFEMSYGPVMFDVVSNEAIDSFSIKPFEGEFEKVDSHKIHVVIEEPTKFLITLFLAESGMQDFIVSAEMPDWKKPKKDARGVLYLSPGVHKMGANWNPFKEGIHTLYLEGGAVLEATLNTLGTREVTILGRGIVSQAFAKNGKKEQPSWSAVNQGISITDCKKVKIDGVAVMGSPGCQLGIYNADEVLLKNIKLCGFGAGTNDGLHLFSRNVIADDLWIVASGDRITLNGKYDAQQSLAADEPIETRLTSCIAENIQIRNVVSYGVKSGADLMLSRNADANIRTVLVENIASLTPTDFGFLSALHSGDADIFDVVIIDSKLYHGNLVNVEILPGEESGKIRSLYLDDISLTGDFKAIGKRIQGYSNQRNIEDVIFTNVSLNGENIPTFHQMNITNNSFVKDIKVKVELRDEY